jgi:hypothetical protein
MPEKKASKAARPPAEAPMPTMGKGVGLELEDVVSTALALLED